MTERVIKPVGRGFLFLDSHPAGCAQSRAGAGGGRSRPVRRNARSALVIGSSSGYGLATTIAGLARYGIDGIGDLLREGADGTAYGDRRLVPHRRDRRVRRRARQRRSSFVNADAFADTTKAEVLDLIAEQFGGSTT